MAANYVKLNYRKNHKLSFFRNFHNENFIFGFFFDIFFRSLLRPLYFEFCTSNLDFLVADKHRSNYSFGRSKILLEIESRLKQSGAVEVQKMSNLILALPLWSKNADWKTYSGRSKCFGITLKSRSFTAGRANREWAMAHTAILKTLTPFYATQLLYIIALIINRN